MPRALSGWPYVVAVAIPLAILALAGWLNLHQIEDEAERRIARTSQALSEHALRTFRTHEVVLEAVDRHMAGWTWDGILASQALHDLLAKLASSAPDVASIFVMHPDGRRFNSSRRFPMPSIDVTDRDYYNVLRERDTVHVSAPALSRLSNDRFFSVARRRVLGAGGFDGLIAVSVNPEYFERFYATVVETPQDSVALVRADGVILARYPKAEPDARIPAGTFDTMPGGGSTRIRSPVDGVERLGSFRPVGNYGVYAAYGLSTAAILAAWRQAMIPYVIGTLLAAAALVLAARRREADHAAAARRAEEERLHRWTDAVPALVSYIDRDLRYRFNNKAYEDWFGHKREAIRGRHVAEVLGDSAFEKLRPHFEAALAGRSVTYEALAPYRDGGARHIQASYVPDRGPDGAVRGMFVLVLDITARKQAEIALAESDRAKDEFLAVLAHELRNPLAPIVSGLEVMKRTPPGAREALEARAILERQAAHLARLVDDLLDVGRIVRGRLEIRREHAAVATLVNQAVETCRPQLESAGHRFEVSLPPEPLYVDADPVRIVQALGNILNNAAKYTRRGGYVALSAARAGERVEIRVRDTGIGIPHEMLPRVFDMFSRAEPALEQARGGLGIGLTLAKRILELHGGTVSAHSEGTDRGSEFTLSLPLAAAAAPAGAAKAAAPAGARRRVLVVDDNRDAAASLVSLLKLSGHDALYAADGEEGVRMAASCRPDVVLLDIGLPKMDGYEACRRIRAQAGIRGMQIVALTGWGQEEDRRRSSDAGFDAHLVKPVDFSQLELLLAQPGAAASEAA